MACERPGRKLICDRPESRAIVLGSAPRAAMATKKGLGVIIRIVDDILIFCNRIRYRHHIRVLSQFEVLISDPLPIPDGSVRKESAGMQTTALRWGCAKCGHSWASAHRSPPTSRESQIVPTVTRQRIVTKSRGARPTASVLKIESRDPQPSTYRENAKACRASSSIWASSALSLRSRQTLISLPTPPPTLTKGSMTTAPL